MWQTLILLFWFAIPGWAEPPSFLDPGPGRTVPIFGAPFVVPTEHNQRDSIPIVKEAPSGAYVSVGFERSFVGAAITPAATHLVILDRNPNLVQLARYNAGLLALARDRADYLQLRLKGNAETIRQRTENSQVASDYRQALLDPETEKLFDIHVREKRTDHFFFGPWGAGRRETFSVFHSPPPNKGGEYGYRDANYLHDDKLFERLQAMARAGNISAAKAELSDKTQVKSVVAKLAERSVGLSVLDVSDTWYHSNRQRISFLTPSESLDLWQSFGAVAKPESVLLMTAWDSREKRVADARPGVGGYWKWIYFGMTYENVMNTGTAATTLNRIVDYYHTYGQGNPAWAGRLDQTPSSWPPLNRPGCLLAFLRLLTSTH